MAIHTLDICAGYGGISLGLHLAFGEAARTVCYIEREAVAAATLVARMEDQALDQAPIWNDLCTFDGKPWEGAVDCITAGIPCQPWSVAGKQEGFDDERHLGEELVRVVGEVGPSLVFVENVSGFVRQGSPDLIGRLAELGYDSEWGLFSAEGVGAPHRRQRFFLLAYSTSSFRRDCQQRESSGREADGVCDQGQAPASHDGEAVADTDSRGLSIERLEERPRIQGACGSQPDGHGDDRGLDGAQLAHAGSERPQGLEQAGAEARAAGRGDRAAFPPGPKGDWSGIPEAFHPAIESGIRGVAPGPTSRVDQLRMLGNGVVPLVAAHAFLSLLQRHGLEVTS